VHNFTPASMQTLHFKVYLFKKQKNKKFKKIVRKKENEKFLICFPKFISLCFKIIDKIGFQEKQNFCIYGEKLRCKTLSYDDDDDDDDDDEENLCI
jgi:hypothetical protein